MSKQGQLVAARLLDLTLELVGVHGRHLVAGCHRDTVTRRYNPVLESRSGCLGACTCATRLIDLALELGRESYTVN